MFKYKLFAYFIDFDKFCQNGENYKSLWLFNFLILTKRIKSIILELELW